MPMKVKTAAAAKAALPRIPGELLDQLVTGPMTHQGIEEVMRGFKKALIERALGAEMRNSGKLLNSVLTIGQFDRLGLPQLS